MVQSSLTQQWRYTTTSTTPTPPPPSGAASSGAGAAIEQEALKFATALQQNPELARMTLDRMTPESRRRLVIAGGAFEWFGKDEVSSEVQGADFDKDKLISPKDFDRWFEQSLKKRQAAAIPSAAAAAAAKFPKITPDAAVPFAALVLIAIEAGLPFVGFGFLDNACMILAGDAIDQSIGLYFNLSVMATAAMGNICSGVMGMQVHGFVEKLVERLHLPVPPLNDEQRKSRRVFLAGHIGGTCGIALGLTLGMLPLLFLADEEEKMELKVFHQLDADGDGIMTITELCLALNEIGLPTSPEIAQRIIHKFGGPTATGLNFKQFHGLIQELRTTKTVA